MKVRDLGAWRTLGCGLQWKTGSRFPIPFQVGKLLHVYYGPLGRRWHFSAISIYILYTQLTDLGLQKNNSRCLSRDLPMWFWYIHRGPNNLSPTMIWSWRIRGDSQPFRLVSCQQTLGFRTFVSASANNKRVVRGPQNYFMSAKIL